MNCQLRIPCLLLFLTACFVGGCASSIENRTLRPKVICVSKEEASTQIVLEQTQHIEQVFTPEGLRDSVQSSDFRYSLKEPDGTLIALPFLTAENADYSGRIEHIFYNKENAYWIGINITPTNHSEHIRGLFEWRSVDDDYIQMRIKTFSRNKLISAQKISICNPVNNVNPIVLFDKTKSALRYCTSEGTKIYIPAKDIFRIESTNNCCPAATKDANKGISRSAEKFLMETDIQVL